MKKKRILKNWVSNILYIINTTLILLVAMLLAELNNNYLFYVISLLIIFVNTKIIHNFSSSQFIKNNMNIFKE